MGIVRRFDQFARFGCQPLFDRCWNGAGLAVVWPVAQRQHPALAVGVLAKAGLRGLRIRACAVLSQTSLRKYVADSS